jgi:hypothetical protein
MATLEALSYYGNDLLSIKLECWLIRPEVDCILKSNKISAW